MADVQSVEFVVRCLLDAMRNAHMRLLVNDPAGALASANEAKHLHSRLTTLFKADPANQAAAGLVMCEVIGQRCTGLLSLAEESLATPQPREVLEAFVRAPSRPVNPGEGR